MFYTFMAKLRGRIALNTYLMVNIDNWVAFTTV